MKIKIYLLILVSISLNLDSITSSSSVFNLSILKYSSNFESINSPFTSSDLFLSRSLIIKKI